MAEETKTTEGCTHDCSTCSAKCSSRKKESLLEAANPGSNVKKIIAVVSGKGGVGKSLVTSLMAVNTQRSGKKTAVLDADITGPSIPKIFGTKGEVLGDASGMIPLTSSTGIKLMSINLLLQDETMPVVWRGPVIAGAVKQFWTDVVWGEVDYMYVDMPPGTGDVPLTVFQSLPISGIIIVTSPQELVSMIVEKAVNMAKMMNIPILGLVENYSYFVCPDCGKQHKIYGDSHLEAVAAEYSLPILGRLPIDPALAALCDGGAIETVSDTYLPDAVGMIEEQLK